MKVQELSVLASRDNALNPVLLTSELCIDSLPDPVLISRGLLLTELIESYIDAAVTHEGRLPRKQRRHGARRALGRSMAVAYHSLRGDTRSPPRQGDKLRAHSKAGWET